MPAGGRGCSVEDGLGVHMFFINTLIRSGIQNAIAGWNDGYIIKGVGRVGERVVFTEVHRVPVTGQRHAGSQSQFENGSRL